jgi:hypothetical protein
MCLKIFRSPSTPSSKPSCVSKANVWKKWVGINCLKIIMAIHSKNVLMGGKIGLINIAELLI